MTISGGISELIENCDSAIKIANAIACTLIESWFHRIKMWLSLMDIVTVDQMTLEPARALIGAKFGVDEWGNFK